MYLHYARGDYFSLIAIAQAAEVLFVGWDCAAFGGDKFNGKIGGNVCAIAGWYLRLTAGDKSFADYQICPANGKHYITGLIGGEIYKVSLLVEDAVRDKHALANCGWLKMPENQISAQMMRDFPISREDFLLLFGDSDNSGASAAEYIT